MATHHVVTAAHSGETALLTEGLNDSHFDAAPATGLGSVAALIADHIDADTFTLKEDAGTTRHTWTIAAASKWKIATSTSLSFDYNTTQRFKIDSTGIGFYDHAPVAQQVLATGAGATVDNVITALQALGLVKQA